MGPFGAIPDGESNAASDGCANCALQVLCVCVLGIWITSESRSDITDISDFDSRIRKPLRPHLLCTRGFHPYYRIDLIARAFEEAQKVFPEARLDPDGGGPLEKEIRSLVEKLRPTGVRFLRLVPQAEIGTVYDLADIFVNASLLENMPVSALEAFASGAPVLAPPRKE